MYPQYLYPEKNEHKLTENCLSQISNNQSKPSSAYLQLCLASDFYFIPLIKRMEDHHSAHIYMDSISWETKWKAKIGRVWIHETMQQNIVVMSPQNSRSPVDSMREAVLTVSPKRQYRGIVRPTTPATQGPENKLIHLFSLFKDGLTLDHCHQTCISAVSDSKVIMLIST